MDAPNIAPLLAQAVRLLKAARPAEAAAVLRQAARLQPANAVVQHDLGLACLEAGSLAESVQAFAAALAARPRYADAAFRMGIALEAMGDEDGALRAYDKATEIQPSLTEAWFRAGALAFTLGHREAAVGCFRRAASSGPKTGFGRLAAARALLAEERDAEAEPVLRRLLALEPGHAMAQDLLGNLLADAGRFEEARACFEQAVSAPRMAGSYYDLVRCRRMTQADRAMLPRMEAALDTPGLDAQQVMRVHLAIGKMAADLGDPAQAMAHFGAADSVRARIGGFDLAAFTAQVDRMIARFTPDLVAQAGVLGSADATPVLIIGMPRSGTTLTEQILSSHAEVAAGGELNFWNERGMAWLRGGAGAQPEFLAQAQAEYLRVLRGIGPDAVRVTDKMPFNFLWAGLIHLAFPRALIIHCRRAPIDTALSIHQTLFNPRLAFPTGGAALVAYFALYERLIAHWRRVLPADRFLEIDYEAMTHAPGPVIARMLEASGLPWDEACLHPERNPRAVRTASRFQARQAITPAAERWRAYAPYLGALSALAG